MCASLCVLGWQRICVEKGFWCSGLVTWSTHCHLLILLELHELQEMMGTAPGHVFLGEDLKSVLLVAIRIPKDVLSQEEGQWCHWLCHSSWAVTSGCDPSLWLCVPWCCFWHCCGFCVECVLVRIGSVCVCVFQEDPLQGGKGGVQPKRHPGFSL